MDVIQKIEVLADAAKYDASCASSGAYRKRPAGGLGNSNGSGICHSYTPDGRCISLLKLLFTNACIFDCSYCVNRVSSDIRRAQFTVQEVVDLTLDFYRRNYIEGLFLSSGVIQTPDYTMQQLIAVAKTLREVHRFGGYIHLKIVAGASDELAQQAGRYADRVSVNIEMPTQADLNKLAPAKTHAHIEKSMDAIQSEIQAAPKSAGDRLIKTARTYAAAGQSTQMVIGASPTPDRLILTKAADLYSRFRLRRVYYSAFSPIPKADPTLPLTAAPLVREHRLYQSDWLLRFYGFKVDELATDAAGNLSLDIDPKLAWALRHRELFPLDVNHASREQLLRVPGLGVRTVDRLISERRFHALSLKDISMLRVPLRKIRHFLVATDHHPDAKAIDQLTLPQRFQKPRQLELLDAYTGALTGQL